LAQFSQYFEHLEKIPGFGQASSFDIHPGLHRIEQDQRVIFYPSEPDSIVICRVLHRRMLVWYEDFFSSFPKALSDIYTFI
jgi:plasmid stabilization system protein ParE